MFAQHPTGLLGRVLDFYSAAMMLRRLYMIEHTYPDCQACAYVEVMTEYERETRPVNL